MKAPAFALFVFAFIVANCVAIVFAIVVANFVTSGC